MEQNTIKSISKVALAYSGGLDSALCLRLLEMHYHAKEIIPVIVDIGQGQAELDDAVEKARKLGFSAVVIDSRRTFAEDWISKAIKANALYGEYPVSSSMTRQLIASEVAKVALKEGCDAVAEGSSGKGNDQFRFHNTFTLLAPELRVVAPIRDLNLYRVKERELAQQYSIPFYPGISDDKTMWGRSVGSGEIGSLVFHVPEKEYIWWIPPTMAPDRPTTIDVQFEKGIPIYVDNAEGIENIIHLLNDVGGKNGIGRIDTIEDGIMGLKSREVYEAPAALILIELHKDLEKLCLTKDELIFKASVDLKWASLVYHGKWFHPLKESLDAFIENSQKKVSGKLKVQIYKGSAQVIERESDVGLFAPDIRSLELESFDQRDAGKAVELLGLEFSILARRAKK